MLDLLKKHFGYDASGRLQAEVVASVLERRDTLVLMPTGGGKSLCYQLPALRLDGLTLVVSPLIALMKDQVDTLKANGIAAELINSSLTYQELKSVRTRVQRNAVKILYVAPERLALSGFQDFLAGLKVSLVAVDEAHCISMWGHEFRPDYRNLVNLRRLLPGVPFIALTATATEQVRRDVAEQLELTRPQEFIASFNRANLTYSVRPKRNSVDALADLLHKYPGRVVHRVLLFPQEHRRLGRQPVRAGSFRTALPRWPGQYRTERDPGEIHPRRCAHHRGDHRLRDGDRQARRPAGRALRPAQVARRVLPGDGPRRARRPASECALFYSYGDKVKQDIFIEQIEDAAERRNAQDKLARMIEFCGLQTCRRKYLLTYFGEDWPQDNCAGCDVCLTPREEFDATTVAQKILSAVVRTGRAVRHRPRQPGAARREYQTRAGIATRHAERVRHRQGSLGR